MRRADSRRRRRLALFAAAAAFLVAPRADAQDALRRAAASRAKGEADAPVLVYEVADFQCPYCARFSREVFPLLDSAYVRTGKVHWVFVNLPLPSHGNAWLAAEAALCAGAVADRFWRMHDRLFAEQAEWRASTDAGALFAGYARELGVPADAFQDCQQHDRVAALLLEDVIFAASARISGTPTFIINKEQAVVGLKSYQEWTGVLEEALKKKAARRQP